MTSTFSLMEAALERLHARIAELEAERDRLKAALTTAEQVLDAAQIAFRGRDMDTREMKIMQACQIARDAARSAISDPSGEAGIRR